MTEDDNPYASQICSGTSNDLQRSRVWSLPQRMVVVSIFFFASTYLVALPGAPIPPNWLLLIAVLPALPMMFAVAPLVVPRGDPLPIGAVLFLMLAPALFWGVCNGIKRSPVLLIGVAASLGLANGLLARWCLFVGHAYST